nr:hypothetical protein [Candidatus Sigynarchaeota archaeon]
MFYIYAEDNDNDYTGDNLWSEKTDYIEVIDDDLTPPIITIQINGYNLNPIGGIDVNFTVDAWDPESGIDVSNISISCNNAVFYSLGSHVVTVDKSGTWNITARIFNADLDRGSIDQEFNEKIEYFNITDSFTKEMILDTIKRGILKIQSSEDQQWRQPGENRKRVMQSKFEELYQLVSAECDNYNQAYEKLLHDIKPKLTGLKTDENENPWGNGMFSNP